MASGTIVRDDGAKEKERYTGSKFYTRKALKGPKNKVNTLYAVVPATTATTPTNDDDSNTAITAATTVENRNPDGVENNGNNDSTQQMVPVDGSSAQLQVNSRNELPLGNGTVKLGLENKVKISLGLGSKQELRELKRKLERELDVVRRWVNRFDGKQGLIAGYGNESSTVLVRHGSGAKHARSEVASAGVPRETTRPADVVLREPTTMSAVVPQDPTRPAGVARDPTKTVGDPREPTRAFNQLSVSVLENSHGVSENVEKEKRTPKANQFYRNSEFLLAKDRIPLAESNKKSKLNGKKHGGGEIGHGFATGSKYFKSCSALLEKLMKHKHGWVFNTPVDVKGLGLHDYLSIITHPMDLGTVNSRLNKNWYKSPKEFAEDVRLTFRNAMKYNPKGQDVHVMADLLSKLFEEKWAIIESNYDREMGYGLQYGAAAPTSSPLSRKAPSAVRSPPLDSRRILERSESMTHPPKTTSVTPSARTPAPKKPKARDPVKRDMTYEEKQKLSTNLQNLPSEKLDVVVQIIKKRNSALSQYDDEIEVDIDSVDAETLWELDRFVTNYKKSLSKYKRKAELAQARAQAEQNTQQQSPAPARVELAKETQADERNVPPSLPAQGEIQVDKGSKSSSSSGSGSDAGSSSDSDSDSSSASGSDAG